MPNVPKLEFLIYEPETLEPFLQDYVKRPNIGLSLKPKVKLPFEIERYPIFMESHKLIEVQTKPEINGKGIVVEIKQGIPEGTILKEGYYTRTVGLDYQYLAKAIIEELKTDSDIWEMAAWYQKLKVAYHWGDLTSEEFYRFFNQEGNTQATRETAKTNQSGTNARPAGRPFENSDLEKLKEKIKPYLKNKKAHTEWGPKQHANALGISTKTLKRWTNGWRELTGEDIQDNNGH